MSRMVDHFATLGQPRRPWLDAEVLKEEFHRRSASLHPDVPGTGDAARFAALNTAHTVLREPATRSRYLLELIAPAVLTEVVVPPVDLGDLFMRLAGLRRRLDHSLERRAAATAPLTLALLAGNEAELRREFTELLARLESESDGALRKVRELDAVWSGTDRAALESLAWQAQRLAYLARWLAQTREALFALGV